MCEIKGCKNQYTNGVYLNLKLYGMEIERVFVQLCEEHERIINEAGRN